MLQTLKARLAQDRKHDEGFTLIELMVVVLIIAILLAIAIPTFLGAQNKAKDRSAQSSLRDTVVAAKSIFVDSQDYTKATASGPPAWRAGPHLPARRSADPKDSLDQRDPGHVQGRGLLEVRHLLLHPGRA